MIQLVSISVAVFRRQFSAGKDLYLDANTSESDKEVVSDLQGVLCV